MNCGEVFCSDLSCDMLCGELSCGGVNELSYKL